MSSAAQNPTDMSPPAAVARSVRIANAICVGMMDSMSNHPLNRSALERHCAAGNQKVLHQFRHSITAMGQQAMPAHADAETATYPIKNDCADQRRPAKKEQCQ